MPGGRLRILLILLDLLAGFCTINRGILLDIFVQLIMVSFGISFWAETQSHHFVMVPDPPGG